MMIWRGLTYVLSGGQTVGIVPSEAFRQVFNGSVGIIPVQFIWLVALTVVFWLFMTKHTFGNHAMATGGDLKVAQALGLNTARIKVICFIVLGIVTALGANFDAVRVRTVFPTQGEGLALIIIAAVLIGGTKLNGGEGTIWGTFFGVVLIYTIQDVLLLLRVRAYYFQLFVGIVIIFAVIMNIFFEERKKQ
jgi:simple sugar transport system permease protein